MYLRNCYLRILTLICKRKAHNSESMCAPGTMQRTPSTMLQRKRNSVSVQRKPKHKAVRKCCDVCYCYCYCYCKIVREREISEQNLLSSATSRSFEFNQW